MKPAFSCKIIRLLIGVAVFSLAGNGPARAENGFLPIQIPPWITADNGDLADRIDPAPQKNRGAPRKQNDSPRLLKPDDYQAALEKLGTAAPLPRIMETSTLEDMYSRRVKSDVTQFGYELFDNSDEAKTKDGTGNNVAMPAGAVQDNFVLAIGDKLNIVFRGQRSNQGVYSINSDGQLVVDDLNPIAAAGKTIGEVREMLRGYAADLHNTDVFVSLESVKQVGVLVIGNVKKPGRKVLTVFNTALDALVAAGGVEKTGSLRQIKLVRGNTARIIDLYALLNGATNGSDLNLLDGDKIVIPTIGPTLAIAGGVKRPGIYETTGRTISVNDALALAGGLLSPGNNRITRLTMTADGREVVEQTNLSAVPALGDGSILMVDRAGEKRSETVELGGNTRQPGLHALRQSGSLSALLQDPKVLGPDIYPLIGVISREDRKTLSSKMIDFPPNLVVHGEFDRVLQDGDKILLFTRKQIKDLQKEKNAKTDDDDNIDPIDDATLQSFLRERSVYVRGSVRDPGAWPVSGGATLDTVLAAAGGLNLDANTANIELTTSAAGEGHQTDGRAGTQRITIDYNNTSPDDVAVAPGDAIRVNQKFQKTQGQSIALSGEVNHPGRYDLLPGDTLGKLLERAGGLFRRARTGTRRGRRIGEEGQPAGYRENRHGERPGQRTERGRGRRPYYGSVRSRNPESPPGRGYPAGGQ
ncbi:MAG: Capsular polysaccharide export system periplasmic protein KpsD [Micavibrio sp.]|nr:Capsular polysaccharide export system periplasmic protein KpsD [Micavibrio sp.]